MNRSWMEAFHVRMQPKGELLIIDLLSAVTYASTGNKESINHC